MSKYQVKYEDSNNNTVVLAQHRTNNNDPDLDADAIANSDRILITRQAQGFFKAKIWCDPSIIGNIPLDKSEYADALNGQNEREILIEEWTGSSWNRIFRGKPKAGASTDDNGQALFILQGFGQQTGKEDVNYDSNGTTLTIDTVLSNVLPNGYTVSSAPAADWPGGSKPEIENYRIIDEQRQVAYRELTKNYEASIQFTSDLDSGNYVVRIEPIGHGGTVDTIQGPRDKSDSGTLGLFREWEGKNPETVINKVKIKGTDQNGDAITSNGSFPVVKDQNSIDKYGVKFKSRNVPYVNSFSEGENIAQNILRPDAVPGGGVIKTPRYVERVVNASFDLKDSRNNVDAVYRARKTRNYLHEQATEIVFEYETGTEPQAENQVETVYERNKVYPNQEGTVQGDTTSSDINTDYSFGETTNIAGINDGNAESVSVNAPSFSAEVDFVIITIDFTGSEAGDYFVDLENSSTGNTIFSETLEVLGNVDSRSLTAAAGGVSSGDTIKFTLFNQTGVDNVQATLTLTVDGVETHVQSSDTMTADTITENETDR